MLKTVMMRVSTLEKKMESLREENLSEKLKNKHLRCNWLANANNHKNQRRQSQLPNHHQNTNDDDGEVDDVKTLVMMRRAAGTRVPERRRRRRRHRTVPRLHNEHQKNKIVRANTRRLFLPRRRRQTASHTTQRTRLQRAYLKLQRKRRTFAPNDPRRERSVARAQMLARRYEQGPSVDTSVDTSAKEKKRQLKKEVVEREREERASKKAKTRDDNSSDDDGGALAVKFQKRRPKKEKKNRRKANKQQEAR